MVENNVQSIPLKKELFSTRIENNIYTPYTPLRQAGFQCNVFIVNFLATLKIRYHNSDLLKRRALIEFISWIGTVNSSPEHLAFTFFNGEPQPTSVTLFITPASNLQCTCYFATIGDIPRKSKPLQMAKKRINFIISSALKREEKQILIAYSMIKSFMQNVHI